MKLTPLHSEHLALKAQMASFAGYSMPIQYADGILKEHQWVRASAGMFDVSHMGQAILKGPGVSQLLSMLTPSDFKTLALGKAKYTVLTNFKGGIVDDLIVTRLTEDSFFLVLNAACVEKDVEWITSHLGHNQTLELFTDRALIALQGPKAEAVLEPYIVKGSLKDLKFMHVASVTLKPPTMQGSVQAFVSRTGYTGEDGFEISLPGNMATHYWQSLLKSPDVKPIGLGARDSLRLEMGYPLYGNDLTDETSPVEASLSWVIAKGASSFIGHERIQRELDHGPERLRVGIALKDKGVPRAGMTVLNQQGAVIGTLCSGGFGPTLNQAVGMAYLPIAYTKAGMPVTVDIRGRRVDAEITAFPFRKAETKK